MAEARQYTNQQTPQCNIEWDIDGPTGMALPFCTFHKCGQTNECHAPGCVHCWGEMSDD